jgi:hypothetical protein
MLAVLLTVGVAGCATVVNGAAKRDPGFTPGDTLSALLNPGNYPTKPRPPLGAGGPNDATLEGRRMADYVVGPWDVDPALTLIGYDATMVWDSPAALGITLAAPAPDIAGKHGFLVGFGSARAAKGPPGQLKALTNAVLRFAGPADAAAAAQELGAPTAGRAPFPVPGHPDAVAVSTKLPDGTATIESYTPHGMYVLYDYARSQDGNLDTAGALAAKAIDLQGPRIDQFTPTDPAKFADLPIDPSGLLARTLPLGKKDQGGIGSGEWGPYAALHFTVDPVTSAKVFAAGALVGKTYSKSMIFESKDAASGKQLFAQMVADPAPTEQPAAGVPGMPSAKCVKIGDDPTQPQFTCTMVVDRYVAVVASGQLIDAQQQAAAQYLILTAK